MHISAVKHKLKTPSAGQNANKEERGGADVEWPWLAWDHDTIQIQIHHVQMFTLDALRWLVDKQSFKLFKHKAKDKNIFYVHVYMCL